VRARVQKWGNSLGLRIPKAFAKETRLEPDAEVEMSVKGGRLIVEAVEPTFTLKALLEKVTPENIHGEVSTGKRLGKEIW
jgi:antitoxin MazE